MSASAGRHDIRLVGPWTVTLTTTVASEHRSVRLPASWRELFGPTAGRAVFERRFNRPSGLTERHCVSVVLPELEGDWSARLNNEPLRPQIDAGGAAVVDITQLLRPHNRLEIEIVFDPAAAPENPGGLWRPVLLRIEERPSPEREMR